MKKHEETPEDRKFEREIRAVVLHEQCPECHSHAVEVRGGNTPFFDDVIYYLECADCLHQWDHG